MLFQHSARTDRNTETQRGDVTALKSQTVDSDSDLLEIQTCYCPDLYLLHLRDGLLIKLRLHSTAFPVRLASCPAGVCGSAHGVSVGLCSFAGGSLCLHVCQPCVCAEAHKGERVRSHRAARLRLSGPQL